MYAWSKHVPKWDMLIWPLLAGAAHLVIALNPGQLRDKLPPVMVQWLPFGVAVLGIVFLGRGSGSAFLGLMGYTVLVFGLLARLARPDDQVARYLIAAGAIALVPGFIDILGDNPFSGKALFVLSKLVVLLVHVVALVCISYVVPPTKLPPALRPVDALAPAITAALLVGLPLSLLLQMLAGLIHFGGGLWSIMPMLKAMFIPLFGSFAVIMVTGPAAYEEAKTAFGGGRNAPPGHGGYGAHGGSYPPGQYPPGAGQYPPGAGQYPPAGQGPPPGPPPGSQGWGGPHGGQGQ